MARFPEERLIAALPTELDRLCVQLALATGLRWRDLGALRWIDTAPGELMIDGGRRRVRTGPPVTALLPRLWPLTATTGLVVGDDLTSTLCALGRACATVGLPWCSSLIRHEYARVLLVQFRAAAWQRARAGGGRA